MDETEKAKLTDEVNSLTANLNELEVEKGNLKTQLDALNEAQNGINNEKQQLRNYEASQDWQLSQIEQLYYFKAANFFKREIYNNLCKYCTKFSELTDNAEIFISLKKNELEPLYNNAQSAYNNKKNDLENKQTFLKTQ